MFYIITVQAAVWEKVAKSSHLGKASGPMMIENNMAMKTL